MGIFNSFSWNHLPQRGLQRVSGLRTWLVSLNDAKEHLKIGHTDDDSYILSLTQAAQQTAEHYCNIDLTPCGWLLTCDLWEQTLSMPYQKVRTISSITYYDDNGVLQTWANTNYYIDGGSMPTRITLIDGKTYPSLRNGTGNIKVLFTTDSYNAGFDTVAAQAIKIMITDMYENRQSVIVGRIASSIPKTSQYLLDTIKIQTL